MQKILLSLSIVFSSAIVYANTPVLTANKIEVQRETVLKVPGAQSSAISKITLTQSEVSKVTSEELWKNLDINRDDSVSKKEAIYSQEVSDNWDRLDTNKDEKLDFDEFTQLFLKYN